MGTVIFDFDSTLISVESLEEILAAQWAEHPELEQQIRAITDAGMAGQITFAQSLERRLSLAAPGLEDVVRFGEAAFDLLTEGMADLVADLLKRGTDVHIVSGGLYEAILPVALRLGIPANCVHAVRLKWSESGKLMGIDPADKFSIAKTEGVKPWIGACAMPRIAVGDGMTDYHLFRDGQVDHFVVFTQHVQRAAVIETGAPQASSTSDLRKILENWLCLNKNTP